MSDAVELAVAYVQLVPSLQGSQGAIAEALVPELAKGGDEAGKGWGARFKSAVGGIDYKTIGLGAAGLLAAGFGGLVAVGGIFDDLGDTIRTQTGASGEALDGLITSAKNIGAKVPAEFGKIGPTVSELNQRLGLTGGTLETVASQYLEAGRILGQDVDVRQTTAAFSAFGIEGENVEGAMDALFRVSQSTGVGMNELGATVAKNGAAMQGLGFDFGQTAALAGVLDKAGLNSNKTMGAMGKALVTLAKDGEAPQDAFKRVTGEIGTLISKGDEAGALDLAAKLFGTKGAPQMVQALKDGTLSADSLSKALEGSGDTILGVGADTADFAESWQVLQNNAALALEPLASTVFSALSDTLSGMMPTLTSFGAWLAENQWVLGVVAGIIGGVMVGAFLAWAVSIWATTAALLANPITWIILAIVALIAGLVLLVQNWDAVAAFLSGVWSAVVTAVTDGWNGLVSWFSSGMQGISETLAAGWAQVVAGATGVWNGIVAFFAGVWSSIVGGVSGFGSSVIGFLAGVWSSIVSTATDRWNGLVAFFAGVWSSIVGGVSGFGSSVIGFLAGVWSSIVSTATDRWNGLVSFVTGAPGRIFAGLASLADLGGKALAWFGGMYTAAQNKLNELVGWVGGIPGRLVSALGNIGGMLVDSGRSFLEGLARGISQGVGSAISAAQNALQAVRNLFPFSPAKDPRSPFYGKGYTTYSGAALIGDFAAGVEGGADGASRDVLAALNSVSATMLPERPLTAAASTVGVAERGGDTWHVEIRAEDLEGLRTIEEFIETASRKKRAGAGGS